MSDAINEASFVTTETWDEAFETSNGANETSDATNQTSFSRAVAEVFYSDVTRDFTISAFEQDLPLEVIEQLITSARASLLPAEKIHGL